MIKRLKKHGNSHALIIDKALMKNAGISENTLFQISVHPNGGLLIQSIEDDQTALFEKKFKELNKKYSQLMQRLADL